MRSSFKTLLACAALGLALGLGAPAFSEDPMTKDQAREAWREDNSTRRTRPGVTETGTEVLDVLLEGGVDPTMALDITEGAAFRKEFPQKKMQELKDALLKALQQGPEALRQTGYTAIGEPEKASGAAEPKEKPEPKEAPGARFFASGKGPKPPTRWTGGDIQSPSAQTFGSAGALQFSVSKGEAAERFVVYFERSASTWWASNLDPFWSGKDDYFLLGLVVVPKPGEMKFAVTDHNQPQQWQAAYVFVDTPAGRRLLNDREARWVEGGEPEAGETAIEMPQDYRP